MTTTTFIIILLLILAFGGGGWGYTRWGVGGGIGPFGVLVIVLVVLYFTGNL